MATNLSNMQTTVASAFAALICPAASYAAAVVTINKPPDTTFVFAQAIDRFGPRSERDTTAPYSAAAGQTGGALARSNMMVQSTVYSFGASGSQEISLFPSDFMSLTAIAEDHWVFTLSDNAPFQFDGRFVTQDSRTFLYTFKLVQTQGGGFSHTWSDEQPLSGAFDLAPGSYEFSARIEGYGNSPSGSSGFLGWSYVAVVPEPASLTVLFVAGALCTGIHRYRHRIGIR